MITDNLKQAGYAQETDVAVIVLITLHIGENLQPVRVCDTPIEKYADMGENIYGCTSNNERFIFMPFTITTPQDDKTGAVTAKLKIDNITLCRMKIF